MKDPTPHSAAMLLSDALAHIDLLDPVAAREPVRQMFRAAIELCVMSRSSGKPVTYVLDLAQALVDKAEAEQRRAQGR